ncbi:hypothetical protein [Micromonospora sp. C81]|uniref:hypothetical protein n=1 Tax=Micromonospora sp. C81 TaxID=2824881 RepID=UPI001B35E474|nr:hypothetical protein [Micromonospora sp. C81]MBQ1036227.1 hypothetical protein [Micromonospora sp. C81]
MPHETLYVKGLTWEYQVRADNGDTDDQKSAWSPIRTATASWNTTGSGVPNPARPIRVGTTTPTAPTGLQINPLDANTVQLTWTKNDTAAGYRVWTRDLTNGSPLTPSEETFTEPTHGIAYLTSGFWNYEYCVTSINGTLESARTTCQTPKRPTGN